MSQIYEAMQRAADRAGAQAGDESPRPDATGDETGDPFLAEGAGVPLPFAAEDATALADEPFPIELPERSRARLVSSANQARFEGARPEPGPDPAPDADQRSGSVFDWIDETMAEKVVADDKILPISREQYRRLAATLHDAQATSGLRVVMICSAMASEGKTLTASNLALTLSESYKKRVLLIDADLRRPSLHTVFRINTTAGLSDGLTSEKETKLVIRQVSPGLNILPAGRPSSDPMAGLISERMRRLIDEAKESFDWVIVDTPPIMLLPDANLLTSMVDGVVLVVKAGSTPHELVKRAAIAIGQQRIIGVVLNQAAKPPVGGYGGYYYGYYGYYLRKDSQTAGDQ